MEEKAEETEENRISIAAASSDEAKDFCVVAATMPTTDHSLANEWVVDSSFTKYIAHCREWFSSYTPLAGRKCIKVRGFLQLRVLGISLCAWSAETAQKSVLPLRGLTMFLVTLRISSPLAKRSKMVFVTTNVRIPFGDLIQAKNTVARACNKVIGC
jgi:hypothetical protein